VSGTHGGSRTDRLESSPACHSVNSDHSWSSVAAARDAVPAPDTGPFHLPRDRPEKFGATSERWIDPGVGA